MKLHYKLMGILAILMLVFLNILVAENLVYPDSWSGNGISLKQESTQKLVLNFSIHDLMIDDLEVDGSTMKTLGIPGIFLPNDEGAPNLPGSSRIIAVPEGANVSFTVKSYRTETINQIDIAPAPRIPLDTERGPLSYKKNQQIYSSNSYYPQQVVNISERTEIRGLDIVYLGITPFQYNPVTKELVIYRDIEVEVTFTGGNGHFGEDRLRSRWWDPIIEDAVINYQSIPEIDYSKVKSQGKTPDFEYVIIIPNDPVFISWADSIKIWRTLQGIKTGVVKTSDIGGNTTSAIETYVNNAYNTWDIPPAAFLLIGDYGTSGSTIVSPIYNNYCVSDNIYADIDGNHLPDVVFARMTAQNATHLETMITKFLSYERTPPTAANFYNQPITALGWQTERWFQICSEVVGGFWKNAQGKNPVRINAIYSGTPGSVWSTATNTATVVNYFGPSGLNYIPASPATLGGWSGGNATMVNNAINSGAFALQHRDHGYEQGWGEPDYSSTNIDGCHNTGTNLPWVFSINCLTAKYNYSSEVFSEKFHRYKYNGQNSGALGVTGASEVSYSFVNDAYVWGMMDNLWPNFMPAYGTNPPSRDVLPAFGNAAGKIFLSQSAWPYNTNNKEVTYHLFHHHGDAFTTVYSEVPQYLTVLHDAVLLSGMTTYNVTANDGSFIALTVNGEIIGTGEGTGSPVAISIPVQTPGNVMTITVTKQNYYRYTSQVNIIPPSGAYVSYNAHTISDPSGNNNGLADYGENILVNMTLKNLGSATANNVTATISSADANITITDNTQDWGTIEAGMTSTQAAAFAFTVNTVIPDQHVVSFTINVNGDGDVLWTSYFTVMLNAPVLDIGSITYNDAVGGNGNGRLDPGETVEVTVANSNTGHSASPVAEAAFTCASPYVTIITGNDNLGVIGASGNAEANFSISVDASAPIGTPVSFDYSLVAGGYNAAETFNTEIGLIVEDFETGNFNRYPWTFAGNANWTAATDDKYEGTYSAKSGVISHSQSTTLQVALTVLNAGNISFYKKVSSESGYDYLRFYIDGTQMGQWSGAVDWSQETFPVTAGSHIFKWTYSKDGSVVSGSDCAWVDFVVFPSLDMAPLLTIGNMTLNDAAGNNNGQLDPGETVQVTIPVTNTGLATAYGANGCLTSSSPFLTITNNTCSLGNISPASGADGTFELTLSGSTPAGVFIDLNYAVTALNASAQKSFSLLIGGGGALLEDFETNNFTKFPWILSGTANWTITNTLPYAGTYCAKSGTISHNQVSELSIVLDVAASDDVVFYRKVSSESNYDYLRFYIDGAEQNRWSGTVAWGQITFPVTAGTHTLKWSYTKDGSVSSGSDCAWLDNIELPVFARVITVNVKTYFEGPFNGTEMNANLALSPDFPLSHPFGGAPWNYPGTASVTSVPNANVVDWVLVELRQSAGGPETAIPGTMVAKKPAFILKNGSVVGLDGTSPLLFTHNVTGNLYAVVWHRNHIPIMSGTGLPASGNVYTYDFSTGSGQVYGGTIAFKQIATGIWGMFSGDANADRQVNTGDKMTWNSQAGQLGYKSADLNLDGVVNNFDKIYFWYPNVGASSQVP